MSALMGKDVTVGSLGAAQPDAWVTI
jgi:hypothetical protein